MSSIDYQLTQLDLLEAESIHIMREVAAEFERPVTALLRRQGLHRHAAAGREGLLAGEDPVPADARRHRAQLRRGHGVPRPSRRRARRPADRRLGRGRDRRRAWSWTPPVRGPPATASRPYRCSRASSTTSSTPSSVVLAATRRRRGPKSGSSASATSSASGTPRLSALSCGACTTGVTVKGEHIRIFPLSNWTELDIWQYVQARRARAAVDLLRAQTPGLLARRHADGRHATSRRPTRAQRCSRPDGALPHRRRHDLHRRRRVRR